MTSRADRDPSSPAASSVPGCWHWLRFIILTGSPGHLTSEQEQLCGGQLRLLVSLVLYDLHLVLAGLALGLPLTQPAGALALAGAASQLLAPGARSRAGRSATGARGLRVVLVTALVIVREILDQVT